MELEITKGTYSELFKVLGRAAKFIHQHGSKPKDFDLIRRISNVRNKLSQSAK